MDIDINYSNKILDKMIKRTKDNNLKNILIHSTLEIKWRTNNGDCGMCDAILSCLDDDYEIISEPSVKKEIFNILEISIPEADSIRIEDFKIGTLDENLDFKRDSDLIMNDIYRINRLIKFEKYEDLLNFFLQLKICYCDKIKTFKELDSMSFKEKDGTLNNNSIKFYGNELVKSFGDYLTLINGNNSKNYNNEEYDVFISHANCDKIDYVNGLVKSINKLKINVFYDVNEIDWGDLWKKKLLEAIDNSKLAIIVLSRNFYGREWTEKELEELYKRQQDNDKKIILPLLHNTTKDEALSKYPFLEEIQYIESKNYSTDEIALNLAAELIKMLKY